MAGWNSGSDSDDEPLNLNLFNRKSFGFQGFPEQSENTFKNIVKQLGASCDNYPKYIFTTTEHYKSLTENITSLYDIAFIRDCVDANRYLNVEHYRFTPKDEKREFRDFDPCCSYFHDGQPACPICDPTFKKEVPTKQKRKYKRLSVASAEMKNDVPNQKVRKCARTSKKVNYWEPWESRLLLDYIICNNLFFAVKSPSLYKRIISEGFLTHRTPESMRVYFCKQILTSLDSFELSKPIKRKLNQVHKAMYPSRMAAKNHKVIFSAKNKTTVKKRIGQNKIKKEPHMNNKKS